MKTTITKTLSVLFVALMLLFCLASCDVPAESLVLSHTELAINVGNSGAVTCTVLPEDASDKTVTWTSSDNAVATVNNVGVITAVGAGSCTITVSLGELSESLTVTVKKPVDQIVLNKTDVTIKREETFTFTCTVVPNDASNKEVSWVSSDTTVATVDENGTITGLKAGSCTVTATADGKSAVANITVKEKGPNFKKIYNQMSDTYGWTLGADGSYLMADTNIYDLDDYSNSSIWTAIKAMNTSLGLPDSLSNDMGQTTWSMGKQKETFPSVGIEVTWTYHPDKGMEVTYKLLDN